MEIRFWFSVLCICLTMHFTSCVHEVKQVKLGEHILWYKSPATEWVEALPVGNGRLGAMVFGNPVKERIQLNDDSMWPGDPEWPLPDGQPQDLSRIRELLIEGDHVKADSLFVEKFSQKSIIRSHQTLGDLWMEMEDLPFDHYRRQLDLSTGIILSSYQRDGYAFIQKVFASYPHQAIVIRLETTHPDGFNSAISMSRPPDEGFPTAVTRTWGASQLIMQGMVSQRGGRFNSRDWPLLEGVQFQTRLLVQNEDGKVFPKNESLILEGIHKATLILVSNTSWYHRDFGIRTDENLTDLLPVDYGELERQHIKDHQALYLRQQLTLSNTSLDTLSTIERLERVREGQMDTGLESLLYQYGRYLLIASSRPGTNPANLQGLWNPHIAAPWNADYHLNINLQMNYWLANVTGLGELNMPLFDFIDRLVESGKKTAQQNFGCRGTFIPHATDIWAPTFLRAPTAYWGCSVGAGGWLMQHYWDYFRFTNDTVFLRQRVFPAMEQLVQFYSDWLMEDPRDGSLISAPSTSPENRFFDDNGKPVASCLGSAMDQQIIAELFDNYLETCKILGIQSELVQKVREQSDNLRPGFIIGHDGRILEWDREYQEVEPGHRHMSHLYGFHPGSSLVPGKDDQIIQAVRNTLDHRLAHGGAGTGWSRAWLINLAARLRDGEMAHQHISLLLSRSLYYNLFDAHPPFQIDGNFGYTAGMAEMLLQSHEKNSIRLLPALPEAWREGSVRGLRARGGLVVDLDWKNHKLSKVRINVEKDTRVRVVYGELIRDVVVEKSKDWTWNIE